MVPRSAHRQYHCAMTSAPVLDVGPIIDMDQHLNETFGTWDEADEPFARQLRIVEDEHEMRSLYLGDRQIGPGRATRPDEYARIAANVAVDARSYERERAEWAAKGRRFLDIVEPSDSDAGLRLEALDRQGVHAAVMFPSYGFYWTEVIDAIDPTIVPPHLAAWNSWVAKQCAPAPDRLLGSGQVGFYDVEETVAELHRAASLGLCGVTVCMKPFRGVPWSDPSNEPIWRAFEETGLLLFLHITVMNHSIDPAWEPEDDPRHTGPDLHSMLNRHLPVEAVLADLVLGGVLERHPGIRVVTVECGGLWVQSFLDRLDWTVDFLGPRNRYLSERLPDRPSNYFRNHVRVAAFPFEPLPVLLTEDGADLFLYASDYPHDEGTARGVPLFESLLDERHADHDVRRRFYSSNAAALVS